MGSAITVRRYVNENRNGAVLLVVATESLRVQVSSMVTDPVVTEAQFSQAMSMVESFYKSGSIPVIKFLRETHDLSLGVTKALVDVQWDYHSSEVNGTKESWKIIVSEEKLYIPEFLSSNVKGWQLTLIVGLGGGKVTTVTMPDFTSPFAHMMDRLRAIYQACQNDESNWLHNMAVISTTNPTPVSMTVGDIIIFNHAEGLFKSKTFKVTSEGFQEQDTSYLCMGSGPLEGKITFTLYGKESEETWEETLEGTCAEDAYTRAGKSEAWVSCIVGFRTS